MIAIHYHTNEAIARNPVAFTVPSDGLDKDDYEFVTRLGDISLEDAFRTMNVVDGNDSERAWVLGVRSMMCGDVIVDEDGDVWFCAASGWERTGW